MDPLLITALGALAMVFAMVVLRLHAFLSLLAGGLLIAALTPIAQREWFHIRDAGTRVTEINPATGVLTLAPRTRPPSPGIVHVLREGVSPPGILVSGSLVHQGPSAVQPWRLDASMPPGTAGGFWMVSDAQLATLRTNARAHPVAVLAEGFGNTCRSIGYLILLASIISRCLTDSRAADRIVLWIQSVVGVRRAPEGFALSGFLLGMPSFFDTVFYLLMPLGRGLARRTGRDFLLYTLTIVSGATMAHSLVPPTPGPSFTASEFGVPIGSMMLGGLAVGLLTVPCGVLYAKWANRRWPLPLRALPEETTTTKGTVPEMEAPYPPLLLAVLPILLPIGLIAAHETWRTLGPITGRGLPPKALTLLGQSQAALLVGTVAALFLLARRHRWNLAELRDPVSQAITSGCSILCITAAGGAFGFVIRQTNIAARIAEFSTGGGYSLLVAAFAITTLVRIAQGSATVAMITASGVIAPIATSIPLPYNPVYLALAIGCGSKPVPWMNDSGFWIIGRMSAMTEVETLRSASVMMSLMGVIGFIAVCAGAWFLPFR